MRGETDIEIRLGNIEVVGCFSLFMFVITILMVGATMWVVDNLSRRINTIETRIERCVTK